VNVTSFGDAVRNATGDPINGFYDLSFPTALRQNLGLRDVYRYGLYTYCGFITPLAIEGTCSNGSFAHQFQPLDDILADTPQNFSILTQDIIPPSDFKSSDLLGALSQAAFWLIFIGSCLATAAFLIGMGMSTVWFLLSAAIAMFGSIALLIGAAIWTNIALRAESVNNLQLQGFPIGITVSIGPAIYFVWAACVALGMSILPYMISCFTHY